MSATTIIKLLSAVIAIVVMAVATISIMGSSYSEYQDYYTNIMQEKEYNKYVESLPLEFIGLTAELNEGVEFFEGETPDKSDFLVKAKFTEKGKEFEKILSAEDFDIVIPADFYANGGTVTVSYKFVPAKESEEAEDPKPVIRSADVNVSMRKTENLVFAFEAESSATCGTQNTVAAYYNNNGKYESLGNLTVLENFAQNDVLKYTFTSEGVAFGKAFIRVANTTDSVIDLSEVLELRVNGRLYPLPIVTLEAKPADKDYVFVDVDLPMLLANAGETEMEITFKKDAAGLAIDKLEADTLTRGQISNLISFAKTFGLSVGEYVAMCVDNGSTPKFSAVPGRGSNGKLDTSTSDAIYTMGGVSDGEYLYLSMTTTSNKKAVIYKVEPNTYNIVAKTEQFTVSSASAGNNARLFIKDGKLYCLDAKGGLFAINLSDFNGTCQMSKAENISFASCGTALSVAWVESIGRYAVMTTDSMVHILDENLNKVEESFAIGYTGLILASLAADDKYIYVNYTKDAEPAIPIEVYTWEGEKVGSFSVGSFQLFPASGSRAYNVQSMYIHDGILHVGVCGWGTDSKYYHDWIVSLG